ncbi:MAG TPA: phosphoribosylamine--glycine ligase, partial [Burkholderiaceae bacterium]|nr:phosphoribosylamine--glycine ligase [Burkholderiaceae bacterium]
MKVLVIGSGGREHALVWKLRQSNRVERVYCAPGNGGICAAAECVASDLHSLDSMLEAAHRIQPDLTVVGPEGPLSLGVVDEFRRRGLRIFGPTASAARLESSKSFAKEFMYRHRIPTARYAICDSADDVRKNLDQFTGHIVVKADGLAAGKGVVIARNREEAVAAATDMLTGKMVGEAGARVVLEEFLEGDELSFLVLSDGERVTPLVAAQDHKRVGDGDTGPNTGGMGAYCPAPLATPELLDTIDREVLVSTVHAMKRGRRPFRGVLYAGIMVTPQGPRVLEYNCRFGDPETQPLLMRLRTDLLDLLDAAVDERLDEFEGKLEWDPRPAVCVVMASGGYPGAYEKGLVVRGLAEAARLPDVKVFHAGTRLEGDRVLTDGGRVLGVTALGETLADAQRRAYEAVACISFP